MAQDKLTQKQEAFVVAYLKTGNSSEAYRMAYDAKAMSDEAINVEGCRLLKNPKVALRMQSVAQKADKKAVLTLEEHMLELHALKELGKQNGQISAAIKAEELRGKLMRFYVDQIEHGAAGEFARMSDEDLDDLILSEASEIVVPPPPPMKKNGIGRAKH